MSISRAIMSMLAACVLSACDKVPDQVMDGQPAEASSEAIVPLLAKSGLDIVPDVAASSADWAGKPFSDRTGYDDAIKTYRRNAMFKGGTITVDRTDSGDLKMVVLSSGMASRCGSVDGVLKGVDALLRQIGESRLTEAERGTLSAGAELTRNGILVRTVKGCIWHAVVRPAAGPQ
jgi:hypothetical protein